MKSFLKTFLASLLAVVVGGVILLCLSMFLIVGLVVGISSQFTSSDITSIEPHSILKISATSLPEVAIQDNFMSYLQGEKNNDITLNEAIRAINEAKDNDNIDGIYLCNADIPNGLPTIRAFRSAIEEFKKSGKFVISYGDIYSQKGYYLSSVAPEIYLNPSGVLEINGIGSQTMFYKEALNKLGVQMNIFKVGTYKGAVEPFMLNKLSDANRLQIQEYIDGLWGNIKETIASSRKLTDADVQEYADNGYTFSDASMAVKKKFIDKLAYEYQVNERLKELTNREDNEELKFVSLSDVAGLSQAPKKSSDNEIKVIYANGEIQDQPGTTASTITLSLAKQLEEAQKDDDVKAVVLRVNSPGGSAYISEQIWKQVVNLKAKKPIVVSMGDYAASGGYYISCAASYIYADSMTLTGSIGIFGMFPNFSGVANKVGITTDVVKTSKYASMGMMFEQMTDDEKALIQATVNRGYELFKKRVADGRHMTIEQVDSIGQGRVWLGQKAIKLGLVDALGGLNEAIKKAASLAHLSDYTVVNGIQNVSFFDRFFGNSSANIKAYILSKTMTPEELRIYNDLRTLSTTQGYQAALPIGFKPY